MVLRSILFSSWKKQQVAAIETKSKSFPLLDEVYISSTKLSTKSERSGSATSTLLALVRHQCFWLTNEIANQYRFFDSREKAFPLDTESFREFQTKP